MVTLEPSNLLVTAWLYESVNDQMIMGDFYVYVLHVSFSAVLESDMEMLAHS